MRKLEFLKAFCSPFRRPKIKFYIGKIAIGTPYFLPRRWVNMTEQEIEEVAKKAMERFPSSKKTFEEWLESYKDSKKAVPKKIGFDFVGLGWKTKWGDYRFEYAPVWSFVFLKWQIAITFIAPEQDHYWEAWLYYEYNTDKSLSKSERVKKCRENYPQIWTRTVNKIDQKIDYYDVVLRKKFK